MEKGARYRQGGRDGSRIEGKEAERVRPGCSGRVLRAGQAPRGQLRGCPSGNPRPPVSFLPGHLDVPQKYVWRAPIEEDRKAAREVPLALQPRELTGAWVTQAVDGWIRRSPRLRVDESYSISYHIINAPPTLREVKFHAIQALLVTGRGPRVCWCSFRPRPSAGTCWCVQCVYMCIQRII